MKDGWFLCVGFSFSTYAKIVWNPFICERDSVGNGCHFLEIVPFLSLLNIRTHLDLTLIRVNIRCARNTSFLGCSKIDCLCRSVVSNIRSE